MEINLNSNSILRLPDNVLSGKKNLSDLIEYTKNGSEFVSIMSKRMGSVTLLAYDAGQNLCEHIPANDSMVYIVEGTANIRLPAKNIIVQLGEMILLPANMPHSFFANVPFKMLLVIIKL